MAAPPVPEKPLLLLDYDGTLAPIVDDPSAAVPHPSIPAILERLAADVPLYVITGRDLETLSRLLPISVPAIGLHGAQEGILKESNSLRVSDAEAEALADMKTSAPEIPGVVVEEKGPAFAVHYRHADNEEEAIATLQAWAATAPADLSAVWGKKVVELRAATHSKGTAVAVLAEEHPDRTPVYLGDDTTDEDAFIALHRLSGDQGKDAVTIKVGEGQTDARYRIESPDAVVRYLLRFVVPN